MVLIFESGQLKALSMTFQKKKKKKVTEHSSSPPVVLFIMLYTEVVLIFESVDEILKCDHSSESY